MINYERGDVILVPFPFSDQAITKKRPAVVISSNNYNNISPDIVIMAITGQKEQNLDVGESNIDDRHNVLLHLPLLSWKFLTYFSISSFA